MTARPTTNKWPDYHCAERTLDIELPWGGITARIWFDGRSDAWDEDKLAALGESIRRNEHWRTVDPKEFLDWLATMPAVNAVQVFKQPRVGVKVGVMAYTVSFESEADVRHIVTETTADMIRSAQLSPAPIFGVKD